MKEQMEYLILRIYKWRLVTQKCSYRENRRQTTKYRTIQKHLQLHKQFFRWMVQHALYKISLNISEEKSNKEMDIASTTSLVNLIYDIIIYQK